MRVKEATLRWKRFEVEEKTQKVRDLQHMISEFEQMAHDLQRQIDAEEERTGVRDRSHFAYSTFARSASQRRENLMASVRDLRLRLDNAVSERDEATAELEQVDAGLHRDGDRHQRGAKETPADPR